MSTNQKLDQIRGLLNKYDLDALYITSYDEYLNEYSNKEESIRYYYSEFDGSVGDLLITSTEAFLIVDGRYHLQAENQVKRELIKVEKAGINENDEHIEESIIERLIKLLKQVSQSNKFTVGFLPGQISVKNYDYIKEKIVSTSENIAFIGITEDLSDQIKPPKTTFTVKSAYSVPIEISGDSSVSKIRKIRYSLSRKQEANSIFVSALDDIAYCLNIRSDQIPYNSTVKGYLLITQEEIAFFSELNSFMSKNLTILGEHIQIIDLEDLDEYLENIVIKSKNTLKIGIDISNTTCKIFNKLEILNKYGCKTIPINYNPIKELKSIKNIPEIKYASQCFRKADSVFKDTIDFVNNIVNQKNTVSELDIKNYISEKFKQHGADKLSFDTISAVGKNSAMIHYTDASSNNIVNPGDLVLLDAGGYFEHGYATDLTRTFIAGNNKLLATNKQKKIYTIVLKAAINGLNACIPPESTGNYLDKIVRTVINSYGYDYNHSTGHGIGILVHESPPSITYSQAGKTILEKNMVFTIEPGIYIEDWGGVRFENVATLQTHPDTNMAKQGWLKVQCLTFSPVDENLIDEKLLNDYEKDYLEYYKGQFVYLKV